MKVLFLDFDGVLQGSHRNAALTRAQRASLEYFDPACARRVDRVLAYTQARVVVSSSWRYGRTAAALESLLHQIGVRARVAGTTPILAGPRGREIASWIALYPGTVESFAILDDRADADHQGRLVQTDPELGVTDADAERVLSLLGWAPFAAFNRWA